MKFNELADEYKIEKMTFPIWVSVTFDPDQETSAQFVSTRNKFLTLPNPVKDKLASPETADKIFQLGKIFNLNLYQIGSISRILRSYFFKEIKIEDFSSILVSESGIDSVSAQKIANIIKDKLISVESKFNVVSSSSKLSFSQALKQYPILGEQAVTGNPIKMKYSSAPVRPSIKNWLTDYQQKLGVKKHDAVERGSYIFQSENARRLVPQDREKLNYILKALDEDASVEINAAEQKLIFPAPDQSKSEVRKEPISLELKKEPVQNIPEIPKGREPEFRRSYATPVTLNAPISRMAQPRVPAPVATVAPIAAPPARPTQIAPPKPIQRPVERKEPLAVADYGNASNLQFSSPQKMPSEQKPPEPEPRSNLYQSGPYRINPIGKKYDETDDLPGSRKSAANGNIVDLRNNQQS